MCTYSQHLYTYIQRQRERERERDKSYNSCFCHGGFDVEFDRRSADIYFALESSDIMIQFDIGTRVEATKDRPQDKAVSWDTLIMSGPLA